MNEPFHRVRLTGSLDISRYPAIRSTFATLPPVPVLVDLTAVTDADSTFLSEMLIAKRRHPDAFAVLIAPGGNLARLFAMVGLGDKMRIFTDPAAAVAALEGDVQ